MRGRAIIAGALALPFLLGPMGTAQEAPIRVHQYAAAWVQTEAQSLALRGRVAELSQMLFPLGDYGHLGAIEYADGLYAVVAYYSSSPPFQNIKPEATMLETILFSSLAPGLASRVDQAISASRYTDAAFMLLQDHEREVDGVVHDLFEEGVRAIYPYIPLGSPFPPNEEFIARGSAYDWCMDMIQQGLQATLLGN